MKLSVGSAAVEQSRPIANMAAQGEGKSADLLIFPTNPFKILEPLKTNRSKFLSYMKIDDWRILRLSNFERVGRVRLY